MLVGQSVSNVSSAVEDLSLLKCSDQVVGKGITRVAPTLQALIPSGIFRVCHGNPHSQQVHHRSNWPISHSKVFKSPEGIYPFGNESPLTAMNDHYSPLSTIINHHYPLSTIMNHYQPYLNIINHYQYQPLSTIIPQPLLSIITVFFFRQGHEELDQWQDHWCCLSWWPGARASEQQNWEGESVNQQR